ncbi:hypothetical protein P167DRAFT_576038 [Morchella conica CCBAS932]|uniref:Uncharacterized protein n=1 Tax=Morchella conica CCBAS932 TaxID=1392247 RepID=A0A3N4KY73_9PEZI|nr:hypothetical protein P167DRAFT_576038 [Morchella conica CCBAS932]
MTEPDLLSYYTSVQADVVEMKQDFRTMKKDFFRHVRVLNGLDLEINTGLREITAAVKNCALKTSLDRASKADVSTDLGPEAQSCIYKWIQLTESLFNHVDEAAAAVREVKSLLDHALKACKDSIHQGSGGGNL